MNGDSQLPQQLEELLEAAREGLENLSIKEITELLRALDARRSVLETENSDLRNSLVKLHISGDKFADIFENSPVPILFTDSAGRLAELNNAGASLLCAGENEWRGMPMVKYITPADQNIYLEHLRYVKETRCRQSCQVRLIQNHIPVAVKLHSLAIGDSENPKIQTFIADININCRSENSAEFKEAGVSKSSDEAFHTQLGLADPRTSLAGEEISAAPEPPTRPSEGKAPVETQDELSRWAGEMGLGRWELDVKTGEFLLSPICAEMLGYSADEIKPILRDWLALVNPDDRSAILQAWRNHAKGLSAMFECEQRFLTKSGKWRWLCIRGRICERNRMNTPLRAKGTCHDVTDLKLADEKRHRHDLHMLKLAKDRSLSTLAGGVAHDFNNILMVISGNADLSLMETPKDSPLRESLEEIKTAALRAAHLSNQMRAYSGQGHAVLVKTDLNKMLEEVRPILAGSVGKNAELKFSQARENLEIDADTMQIKQVITNLVTNAVESLDNESQAVTIRTGTVEATQEYLADEELEDELEPGRYVFLEVADAGCGMDAATLEKIFDPFFTTKFTGRGLGLGVVLGVVRGHHGAVAVKSVPGEGSTFRILLPAAHSEQTTQTMEYHPVEEIKMGMILVVDDDAAILNLTKLMLEKEDMDVVTAESGQRAVELFQLGQDDISAVLLDISMPGLSGEETFRQLRKIKEDIPIIVCSGLGDENTLKSFIDQDCNGFLQKPFNFDKLFEMLRQSVRKPTEKSVKTQRFSL